MDIIQKALNFAARAHINQYRKIGLNLPYIVHPVSVAMIVTKIGAREEVIAAALLHDVIEDCRVTKEELGKEFGPDITKIVYDVTEKDKSLPWIERKKQATEEIQQMSNDSLLVKTADIIHNLSSMIAGYKEEGVTVFKQFKAGLPEQTEMFKKRLHVLEKKWPQNPLLLQLKASTQNLEKIMEANLTQ